jgi:hypothetical protein
VLSLEGSGVIYVLTIADTTRVAPFLRTGIDAYATAARRSRTPVGARGRSDRQQGEALVGFDKPDLGFVIH